jgi:hypothetical protein
VGAVIQAIIKTYTTIQFFIQRINQILDLVESIVNSIAAIAAGQIAAAANFVERTMARTIPVILDFLARFIGLGDVAGQVTTTIRNIQSRVDGMLDRAVDWIRQQAANLASRALGGDPNAPAEQRLEAGLSEGVAAINRLSGSRVGATLIRPLLAAIRIRNRMQSLEAVAVAGTWVVRGAVNPVGERASNKQADDQGGADEWPSGTRDDPAPIRWYKPIGIYPTIGGRTLLEGITLPATARRDPRPLQVSAANVLARGDVISRRDEDRVDDKKNEIRDRLNAVQDALPVSQTPYSIDHVRDLAWFGRDVYTNLWPLQRTTNSNVNASHYQQVRMRVRDSTETRSAQAWGAGKYFWIAQVVAPPGSPGEHGTDEEHPVNSGTSGVPKRKP